MSLDPDTQKYYEDYFELFATEGWKRFMEDLRDSVNSEKDSAVSRCDTNDKWQFERGSTVRAIRMLNLENSLRTAYDDLVSQEEDDLGEDSE